MKKSHPGASSGSAAEAAPACPHERAGLQSLLHPKGQAFTLLMSNLQSKFSDSLFPWVKQSVISPL